MIAFKLFAYLGWLKNNDKKRTVSVYFYPDKAIMYTYTKTTDGVHLATPPFIFLEPDFDSIVFTEKLTELINTKLKIIKHPKDWKKANFEYFTSLGFKSQQHLQKNCLSVVIDFDGDNFSFYSTEKRGVKMGFYRNNDITITVNGFHPESLFEALINSKNLSK